MAAPPADARLKALYSVMQSIEVRRAPWDYRGTRHKSKLCCMKFVQLPCRRGPARRLSCPHPCPPQPPAQNKLGGGEGVEGLYGSIKKSGMDKVLECLRSRCCLDSRSVLVDIGAGLGRCGPSVMLLCASGA